MDQNQNGFLVQPDSIHSNRGFQNTTAGDDLQLACWVVFMPLLSSQRLTFFLKINFFKNSFMNTIRVSNILDPGMTLRFEKSRSKLFAKGYQKTTPGS